MALLGIKRVHQGSPSHRREARSKQRERQDSSRERVGIGTSWCRLVSLPTSIGNWDRRLLRIAGVEAAHKPRINWVCEPKSQSLVADRDQEPLWTCQTGISLEMKALSQTSQFVKRAQVGSRTEWLLTHQEANHLSSPASSLSTRAKTQPEKSSLPLSTRPSETTPKSNNEKAQSQPQGSFLAPKAKERNYRKSKPIGCWLTRVWLVKNLAARWIWIRANRAFHSRRSRTYCISTR